MFKNLYQVGQKNNNKKRVNTLNKIMGTFSYNPFNRLQLDIFVLIFFEYHNEGYGYILCIIDVFSRKVWHFN